MAGALVRRTDEGWSPSGGRGTRTARGKADGSDTLYGVIEGPRQPPATRCVVGGAAKVFWRERVEYFMGCLVIQYGRRGGERPVPAHIAILKGNQRFCGL
jgi:hypothetical protein